MVPCSRKRSYSFFVTDLNGWQVQLEKILLEVLVSDYKVPTNLPRPLWILIRDRMMQICSHLTKVMLLGSSEQASDETIEAKLGMSIGIIFNKTWFRLDSSPLGYTFLKRVGILRGYSRGHPRSSFKEQNQFCISSCYAEGGSVRRNLPRHLRLARFGGGRNDTNRYLKYFDQDYGEKPYFFRSGFRHLQRSVFGNCAKYTPLSVDEAINGISWNLDANPGPSFYVHGFPTKGSALPLILECSREIMRRVEFGEDLPPILFGVAGRPKLISKRKAVRKMCRGEAVGRAVLMADAWEPVLATIFCRPICDQWKLNRSKGHIQYGFEKFSDDVAILSGRMCVYQRWIVVDFSRFDTSHSPSLLRRAFGMIRSQMVSNASDKYHKLLDYLEENLIQSLVVRDNGDVILVEGGARSGSGFITVLNCILSCIMIEDVLTSIRIDERNEVDRFDFVCHGDNVTIGLSFKNHVKVDRFDNLARRALVSLSFLVKSRFGHTIDVTESIVASEWFVECATPRAPSKVLDGSSVVLRKFWKDKSIQLGRSLKFEEKWEVLPTEPEGEYIGGSTHRWTYVFHRQAQFLSYYFKSDSTMIRPTFEVYERLLNPERKCSTLDLHEQAIINYLVDNLFNAHTVNHLMHLYLDTTYFRWSGREFSAMARDDFYTQIRNNTTAPTFETGPEGPWAPAGSRRFFYRRASRRVDLSIHPYVSGQVARFEKIVARMRQVYGRSSYLRGSDIPYRGVKYKTRGVIELLSRPGALVPDGNYWRWYDVMSELYPGRYSVRKRAYETVSSPTFQDSGSVGMEVVFTSSAKCGLKRPLHYIL